MLNIISMLEKNLNTGPVLKSVESKDSSRIYLYPSEAMSYSTEDGKPIGACIRQVWFNKKKAPISNPKNSYNNFIFEAGHMWEDWLVKQYTELGIYLDRNIKLVDNDLSISCEIDILHKNPETDEIEVTECKQYNGSNHYAAKDLLGTHGTLPKPKDQNLLQCVKYLMVLAKYNIKKVNLIYLDRSCSHFYNNKQFTIYINDGTIYYDTYFANELMTIEVTEFNVASLLEKDQALLKLLEMNYAPDPDYFVSYTPETLELDYERGNVTKTTYNKIKKGEINLEDSGSWLCRYCSFGKNNLTGKSTCVEYIQDE